MSFLPLIPYPAHIKTHNGAFALNSNTLIGYNHISVQFVAQTFADRLFHLFGRRLDVQEITGTPSADTIFFDLSANGEPAQPLSRESLADQQYSVEVSSQNIHVRASATPGLFYGSQTLLQLFDNDKSTFPAVMIQDEPRFAWRGLMLDSSRYFQPVSFLKKWIDLLALHKYNVFHWHLIDDQGWRFESRKYPQLTQISAWRNKTRRGHESDHDGFTERPHGGFYSQEEMRELVAYAAKRNVTIIPEIEMPGHAQAVLAAFPELSCTGGPFETSPKWGIHDDVFCAGNDAVLDFIENILEEVLGIFPSPFIHIGGDECRKTRWKHCPKCQTKIKEEGLSDEHELQSWFVRRIDNYLTKHDRRLVGWDEILEGGLAEGATVMSWRGEKGGITGAKSGHDVVMATQSHVYFDYYQARNFSAEPLAIGGYLPLSTVYSYEPIPAGLSESEAAHVLGGQGQLWTEYMPRPDNVEYMAFPRACALAEILWSPRGERDFDTFLTRLKMYLTLLDRLNVNYRPL